MRGATADTGNKRQPTRTAVALAVPTFAFAGFELTLSLFLPTWLSSHTGLPLASIALFLLCLRVWDTLNDPFMGALSDATASRFGRRRLWIAWGAPVVMLSTLVVSFLPAGQSDLWRLGGLFALTAGWTMINVPHGAWALETGRTAQERARIFGFRTIAGLSAAPVFVLGPALLERFGFSDTGLHMAVMSALILISLPAALFVMLRTVPDRPGSGRLDLRGVLNAYGLVLGRRDAWPLAALFGLAGAGQAIDAGLYFFLLRFTFALPDWSAGLLLLQTLSGVAGIGLWLWVHKRLGTCATLRVVLWLQLGLAAVLLLVPTGHLPLLAVYVVARGLMSGALFMLLRVLLARRLDNKTTAGQAGVQYAAFHLVFNLAGAAATFVLFFALAHLGFEPRSADASSHGPLLRHAAVIGEVISTLGLLWFRRGLRT